MRAADQRYAASDDGLATLLAQIQQFAQARVALARAEQGVAQLQAQAAAGRAGSAAMMARYHAALRSVSSYVRTSYADGAPAGLSSVLGADPTQFVIGLSSAAGGDIAVRSAVDRVQQLSTQAKSAEADAAVARGKVDVAKAQVDRYAEQLRQLAPYITSAQARAAALMAQRDGALAAMRAAQAGDLTGQLLQSDRLGAAIRAAQARLRAEGTVVQGTGTFTRPSRGPVTSHYGWRYHPVLHYRKLHTGVDLGQGDGFVRAADDGTVILTIANEAYGNVTVIDHGVVGGGPIATFYGHQARFLVRPGQVVHKGQVIGVVGQTGWATGPHVHVEVRDDGVPIRPEPFFGL
jgi:murein DD-endopeptidase MepM/ murein hydrolase activator NlpD